jgi:[ribosomal protein S5]-alanine N-acetyltransferase
MADARALAELRSERLLLRAFEGADEDALFALWNHPDVRRFLFDDRPVSRDVVREQLQASRRNFETLGCGYFTVRPDAEAGRVIGFAGLRRYGEAGAVELLYALLPEAWGRGLATEAARAVLRLGFTRGGLQEIHAGADPPNAASFAVMERLGMSLLGDVLLDGRPARYYKITRSEFQRRNPEP